MGYCPYCKLEIAPSADFCPACRNHQFQFSTGSTKEEVYMDPKPCTSCNGTGERYESDIRQCLFCHGHTSHLSHTLFGMKNSCKKCGGHGQYDMGSMKPCGLCGGTKLYPPVALRRKYEATFNALSLQQKWRELGHSELSGNRERWVDTGARSPLPLI